MREPTKPRTFSLALRIGCLFCLAMLFCTAVAGQGESPTGARPSPAQKENAASVGTLTGIVTADDGRPLADAQVYLIPVRKALVYQVGKSTSTGSDGRFRFINLPRRAFNLFTMSPGYVMPEGESNPEDRRSYRPGDQALITLVKGGVITGMVTDVTGAPLVEVAVLALRVRDSSGRPAHQMVAQNVAVTDDRGIYRIHSLFPGAYVVSAGLIGQSGDFQIETSSYDLAPVYHPSSSIEAAQEVNVGVGQESGGIDIRVRSEAGHEVTGAITGATSVADTQPMGMIAILRRAGTGVAVGSTMVSERNGKVVFAFTNVPDGDYELSAETWRMNTGTGAGAEPLRVKVKGADLNGLQLVLTRFGSISGRLVLESLPATSARDKPECATTGRTAVPEEFNFGLRRALIGKQIRFDSLLNQPVIQPDEQGKFTTEGMTASNYWLLPDLPSERYYLRSLSTTNRLGKPVDVGRTGLSLATGEELKGVTISVSEGAAWVNGKLASADPKVALPVRNRLHLVPAEAESADDVLRYREVQIGSDGLFTLANLAPGKYWLHTEPLPDTDVAATSPRPVAWDEAARLKLRSAAEAANVTVELKPCQRVTDYKLTLISKTVVATPR